MRLWIASLLLALFAFQALPVVAMGKAFAKTQWELADDDAPADDDEGDGASDSVKVKKKEVAIIEVDFLPHSHAVDFCSVQATRALFMHRADHLPPLYASEVATPPPNHC